MKKAIRFISLFVVISLILLSFSACGKKSVPIPERLETATRKILDSDAVYVKADMNLCVSMKGIKMDIPVTSEAKMDLRDENAPGLYINIKLSFLDEEFVLEICYKDDTAYLNSNGDKKKYEAPSAELKELLKISDSDKDDFVSDIFDSETMKKAEITEEKDGSFKVKFTEDLKELVGDIIKGNEDLKDEIMDEIGTDVDSFLSEYDAEFGEIITELVVDKDDNIVSLSVSMQMSVNTDGTSKTDITLTADIVFNPIGDDFKIEAPADADSYMDSSDIDRIYERIETAISKQVNSETVDSEITMKSVEYRGDNTIEVPLLMTVKTDFRNENVPGIFVNLKMLAYEEKPEMEACYVDGMLYGKKFNLKIKSKASEEELYDFLDMFGLDIDIPNNIFFDYDMISLSEITEKEDGSLNLKVTVDGEDYREYIIEALDYMVGYAVETYDVEFGETTVELKMDKDNNIVFYSINMDMDVGVEDFEFSCKEEMEIIFNPIGDDFKVEVPADADSYMDSSTS